MTTPDELTDAILYRGWGINPGKVSPSARAEADKARDAVLAKLSEDDPERVKLSVRIRHVISRIGLINTDVDKPSAQKDGPDLLWACKELREIANTLDVAGPSVVERGLVSARDPESGEIYTESQMSDELWHRERTRAEKAEAELERLRTTTQIFSALAWMRSSQ